jgi:hypothetical protein
VRHEPGKTLTNARHDITDPNARVLYRHDKFYPSRRASCTRPPLSADLTAFDIRLIII